MKRIPYYPSIKDLLHPSQAINPMFLFCKRPTRRVFAIDAEMQSLRVAAEAARTELEMVHTVSDGCIRMLMSEKERVELRLKQVSEEFETVKEVAQASESALMYERDSMSRELESLKEQRRLECARNIDSNFWAQASGRHACEDLLPLPSAPTLQTLTKGEMLCSLVQRNNVECPLTFEFIREPVLLECNHVFESAALHRHWGSACGVCPQCNVERKITLDMRGSK